MARPDKFNLRWAKRYRAAQELGGKCKTCGEDNLFCLDFHHINPSEKSFEISKVTAHMPWSKIELELKKCELLCRKCHTLHHMKDVQKKFFENFDDIKEKAKIIEDVSRPKLDHEYIYSLLKQKITIGKIAKILDKGPGTILEIARELEKKHNEKLFHTRKEHNSTTQKVNQEELKNLLEQGKTPTEIAEHFGAAKSTVYALISKQKKQL